MIFSLQLEDYGYIVAWTCRDNLAVIIETDLDHMTKFSTTLMQEECSINDGLVVSRVECESIEIFLRFYRQ